MRRRQLDVDFRESAAWEPISEMPLADRKLEIHSSAEFINKHLDLLDPDVKTIFILRHAEEMTVPEIARVTSCPEGTVKSRLYYAMKKIAEHLHPSKINEWI